MSSAVSVVVPALGDVELLEPCLASITRELADRAQGDELVLVDDTGTGELSAWATEHFPSARLLTRAENGGFARALASGIDAAEHDLVFSMNSDLVARPGFLAPLVGRLCQPVTPVQRGVFAVVPRVLRLPGAMGVESLVRLRLADGGLQVEQPLLDEDAGLALDEGAPLPVPFALGGACLFRASEFAELGGFDPLFEPFYMEDADLCWRAWRGGRQVLLEPRSVCEHVNQATISSAVERVVRDAAIDRNALLFLWKHLDGVALERHLEELAQRARRAWLLEDRAELVRLALALEQVGPVLAARRAQPAPVAPFAELLALSQP